MTLCQTSESPLADGQRWPDHGAIENDLSFEEVFVQPLMNLASEGDVLITLSGLGNSANIRRAIEWAN